MAFDIFLWRTIYRWLHLVEPSNATVFSCVYSYLVSYNWFKVLVLFSCLHW